MRLQKLLLAITLLVLPPFVLLSNAEPAKPDKTAKGKSSSSKSSSVSSSHTSSSKAASSDKKKDSNMEHALLGNGDPDKKPPIFISSKKADLNSKDRIFNYRENVEVVREDLTITADLVVGKYNDQNEMEVITCEQNVVITKGDTLRSTSNRAVYDVKSARIVLTENPEINDHGNILSADKVIIFVDEDRSEAEGNVRVKVTKSNGAGVLGGASFSSKSSGSSATK